MKEKKPKKPHIIYPCGKSHCEYWDSDQNGGHCICVEPPCKETDLQKKEPLG